MLLPPTIKPMLLTAVRQPFDNPEYVFQVKWDGIRLLSFVEQGEVRLQNRQLRDRTGYYPELLSLPELLHADAVVLDGEVIVPGTNGPNFPAVLRREQVASPQRALSLSREIPVCYMVFDLLYESGQSLFKRTLTERQLRLQEVLTNGSGAIRVVENFPSGTALFSAVERAGLEGIVAKKKSSFYTPGTKSRTWQKIKVRRRQLCLVGGYLCSGKRLKSLLIGAWQDQRLVYLGHVGTGLTGEESELLIKTLPKLRAKNCPFDPCPRDPEATWLHPVLPVAVEFSEWTDELRLRAPSIIGFPKVAPEDCRLEG